MGKVKSILNRSLYQIDTARYHWAHKKIATSILRNIEASKGKTDVKLVKLCNAYAKDTLGWEGYAPWLYVYSAIAGIFKEGWIPDNYYGKIVIPKIQGAYGKVSNLKSLAPKLLQTSLFPDIAYYVNGSWFSEKWEPVQENALNEVLFKDFEKIVFKMDTSSQGKGVYSIAKGNFDIAKIKKLGNGVFQYFIPQHEVFDELSPTSVATIRLTTAVDTHKNASVRSCYLRLGRKGDTHVQSKSQIRVPIHIKTGQLDSLGFLNTWCTVNRHPDTNLLFEKLRIPAFEKCVATVLGLHTTIPYIGSIGWDIAIDKEENVQILEWNGYANDIKFSEATQGPCFVDLGWERIWKENQGKQPKMGIDWNF